MTPIDALKQCRDALKLMDATYVRVWDRTDGALLCMPESVPAFEAAHVAVFAALTAADTALAALSEPQDTRKLCTCDGSSRGPGRECVIKSGGRLGELWRCSQEARASLAPAPQPKPEPEPEPMIDGWPLYSMLPPPASKQGEVPMPEPVAVVGDVYTLFWAGDGPIASLINKHSIKAKDTLVMSSQARAYGDARAAAERERCAKLCHEYAAQISITDFQRHTARQLAAAIDARALAAVREPLSDAEIAGLFVELNARATTTDSAIEMFTIIVRAVEAALGITTQAQQEGK